ncbi:MAG: glycoside hydrolase family 3 C-terminal domain-containing protein, partial [Firmicutes bacterium]|nr:glycoside hydrolase family 3 C-terminal domain-containing protein [Bacillota bacterium]
IGDDRLSLDLPEVQEKLLKAVCALGKPVVLVLMNGSPIAVNWAAENVPAIIEAWYPGEEGGTALADVLFGDYSPAGRLPVTFVRSVDDLPPFTDYAMKGRTYRYMEKEPLFPFGYGLSYTTFHYNHLKLSAERIEAGESLTVAVSVKNVGAMAGDEVVQLYLGYPEVGFDVPRWQLRGFRRITLQPGEEMGLEFVLRPEEMALVDEEGRSVLVPGSYRVYVGGSQPDGRSVALTGVAPLCAEFEVVGEARILP